MATYDVVGARPESLIAHGIEKEYIISGITPKDFVDTHTGLDFDISLLRSTFKVHCTDYMENLARDVKSSAVEFCSKIIYEIGPNSRKVRRGTGDKVWKFIFTVKEGQLVEKHTVFVATYKQENAQFNPDDKPKSMILTLKQAGLIALETFSRLIKLAYADGMKLMTPLAGACFSKEDLPALATDLGISEMDLLISINQSTQGGGQYLLRSDVDIAICSSIAATRNVREEALRKNIVIKVMKQYIAKGKMPDKNRIGIIAKYATGGVSADLSYEELTRIFETEQSKFTASRIAAATRQSELTSTVTALASGPSTQ
jgi:hypothetical protein